MDIRSIFRNYLEIVITDGGTQEASQAHDWTCGLRHVGGSARQIRRVIFPEVLSREPQGSQSWRRHAAEKSL
jgi:hypothetical protein